MDRNTKEKVDGLVKELKTLWDGIVNGELPFTDEKKARIEAIKKELAEMGLRVNTTFMPISIQEITDIRITVSDRGENHVY